MKKMILLLFVLMLCGCNAKASTLDSLKHKYPHSKVCLTKDIDRHPEILTKRKNKYRLIEVIYGVCINKRKDGRITNTLNKKYNYITYRGVKGVRKGDRVVTYCVYDNSNEVDTIIERVDVILKNKNY